MERRQKLNEDKLETALLIAGFVPVIGEAADFALILKYIKEKRLIEAGLMLFALIPTVGDVIVKPIIFAIKGSKYVKSTGKLTSLILKNKKLSGLFLKLEKYINNPKIISSIEKLKVKKPKMANAIEKAKNTIVDIINKIKNPAKVTSSASPLKFGKKYKQIYQKKAAERFAKKFGGKKPSNALSEWWYIKRRARFDRRKDVKKLILGNNFLASLGIFNFEDLQNIFKDEEKASKLAASPEFNDFVDDLDNMETSTNVEDKGMPSQGGDNLTSGFALSILKNIASKM